eukprot:15445924-Alexandrium_andersonii.AAC.1
MSANDVPSTVGSAAEPLKGTLRIAASRCNNLSQGREPSLVVLNPGEGVQRERPDGFLGLSDRRRSAGGGNPRGIGIRGAGSAVVLFFFIIVIV